MGILRLRPISSLEQKANGKSERQSSLAWQSSPTVPVPVLTQLTGRWRKCTKVPALHIRPPLCSAERDTSRCVEGLRRLSVLRRLELQTLTRLNIWRTGPSLLVTMFHLLTLLHRTYVQHLEYGHPLTRAAPTALTVVHRRVEPVEVGRQVEV